MGTSSGSSSTTGRGRRNGPKLEPSLGIRRLARPALGHGRPHCVREPGWGPRGEGSGAAPSGR
eukprot:11593135-Alexandrium_andersonii.AAC.1